MEFEGRRRIRTHLDMAPLIDVVFLLLIFFMLTSTFLVQEAIDLDLPEAATGELTEEQQLVVTLDREGAVTVNGDPVGIDDLQDVIGRLLDAPEQRITLRTDEAAPVRDMVRVMDEIRAAGGRNIALSTEPPS